MDFFLGVLLSAVVYFVWSAISWMALPWQRGQFRAFKDEERMAAVLDEQAPGSGLYGLPAEPSYPAGATKEQQEAIDRAVLEKIHRGPVVFAVVSRRRFGSFPELLAIAFAGNLLVSLAFAWMLQQTTGLGYAERVGFLLLASLAAGIACRVPDWNWHKFPSRYTIVAIANLVVGWLPAGLVLAWFVRGQG
jgi:hypothetical protein